MSISPKGKPSSAGNIQKAGQIPFPVGHFALISNLPYKNETLPKVCIRPEVHKALSFFSSKVLMINLPLFTHTLFELFV